MSGVQTMDGVQTRIARFDTLLVANRGEIARRVFRTARSMGLRTVAVFVDADAAAPFVAEADRAVRVESYMDGPAIIAAATSTGSGAIHPGYGFLAENADFAAAVQAAGLAWVGPSAKAIAAMGDKIEAKKLAVDAEVPVLVSTDEPGRFTDIGFPLLIKAAAGGGGKGMRIVESADGLADAITAAQREALSGFGDDRVFAERYVARSRHIEIQIMGDDHGNLVHLGERECSIQRRHQKIIEESPSPFVSEALRDTMGQAAIRLGAALDYRSAGTVEFLVDDDSGDYFFLEVNTRLQVEHPVTEQVTGRDLVADQLRVAMGQPLGYTQDDVTFKGYAIEARLYAEDPANDFLPAIGTLDAFAPADNPPLRWDSGVQTGSVIGVDFDPMIAKVIATASSRSDAAGQLALGLEQLHIDGVVTNRDFLAAVLRSDQFLAGDTTTDFIDRVQPSSRRAIEPEAVERLAVAAVMWLQGYNHANATTLRSIPSGFLIGRLPPERVELIPADRISNDEAISDSEAVSAEETDGAEETPASHTVHYRRVRDGSFRLGATGDAGRAIVHAWAEDGIDVEVDGHRLSLRASLAARPTGERRIQLTGAGGGIGFDVVPRFSMPELELPGGAIAAPMPGKVLEIRVQEGQQVAAGDVVAVLEAMKMENHLSATDDGVVTEIRVAVGDQVEKDVLLMVIESAG